MLQQLFPDRDPDSFQNFFAVILTRHLQFSWSTDDGTDVFYCSNTLIGTFIGTLVTCMMHLIYVQGSV